MKPKITDLPVESVKRLLRAPNRQTTMGRRDAAILALLARTGIRVGELSQLKVGDLNLEGEPSVTVKTLKKRGKEHKRTIPLTPDTVALLRHYLRSRNGTGGPEAALFTTLGKHGPWRPRGITPHVVSRIIKKTSRKAAIPGRMTPHSLRHVFATQLLRSKKVDLRTLQELLGHASLSSTQIYLHPSPAQMREGIAALPF